MMQFCYFLNYCICFHFQININVILHRLFSAIPLNRVRSGSTIVDEVHLTCNYYQLETVCVGTFTFVFVYYT